MTLPSYFRWIGFGFGLVLMVGGMATVGCALFWENPTKNLTYVRYAFCLGAFFMLMIGTMLLIRTGTDRVLPPLRSARPLILALIGTGLMLATLAPVETIMMLPKGADSSDAAEQLLLFVFL